MTIKLQLVIRKEAKHSCGVVSGLRGGLEEITQRCRLLALPMLADESVDGRF